MKAPPQASRLGLKSPIQPKVGPARHGKPVPRGGVQFQAISSGSGLLAPLYQLADAEVTGLPPVVLDAVIDAPPPAALEAAAAVTQAISASSATQEANAVAAAVEAMTETVSEAATAAVSAASDAVAAATDVLSAAADVVTDVVRDKAEAAAEAVSSTAAAASEAVADVVTAATSAAEVAAEAVSSSTTAASEAFTDVVTATASTVAPPVAAPAAPQTLSLAAQRYAEMTSKAPKVAPGGGSSGGASFQAPSFSMPDLSGIQLPKLSAPDISKLSAPDFSKLSVPDLPKLPAAASGVSSEAGMSLPKIDFNKLELPATPAFDVPDVGGAVGGAAAEVSSAAAAAVAGVSAAASDALSGVTSTINTAAASTATALNGATGGLLDELDRELGGVRSAVQSATDAVGNSVGTAAGQVYSVLPPQAQLIARDVGDVAYAFASHPTSSLVLAGLVGVPLGIKSYFDRYGGYSGDLSPATVKELLLKEDVLVVDVRTEEERQESGVLDLRKGARFSAAALPADLVNFSPKWARESQAGERLATSTTALLIAQLNRIRTPLTKVVVMNNNDDLAARELARAVRAAGVLRVYVLSGGFQAWSAAGLGVVPGKTDYEASAFVVLLDEVAEIAAVVGPKLREPAFLATTLATSSIAIYAAVNYHTTLRYFAVWGVFATIYWRFSRYNSPQELFEDVKMGALTAASSAASAASTVARAAASAATSKPPALAAAAAVPALPAAAMTTAAPAPPAAPDSSPAAPAVQLPPPPPTEASPAALAAAMAAAGVAPLPPAAEPSPSSDASPTAEPAAALAPAPAAVTESAAPATAPALPLPAAAMGDTTTSSLATAAAIAASAAAPPSPETNSNGIAKTDKLVTPTELAKEAVPVMTSELSAPAPAETLSE